VNRRVVFDCMVFVQALARPKGPAGACLERARSGACELLVSDAILAEARVVIARPKLRRAFILASDPDINDFFTRLATFVTRIDPVPDAFVLSRDPKDSMYLNLAITGNAELVVSRDNDLLDLMTANDADATAFRTTYPRIRIVDPVAFLQSLPPTAPTNP
jgi:uncharacterized protein